MRVDKATWSTVSGEYDKKLVVIFRYSGFHNSAGKVANKAFGNVGTAGGHKAMARAEIPISEIQDRIDIKDEKSVQQWVIHRVERGAGKKKSTG